MWLFAGEILRMHKGRGMGKGRREGAQGRSSRDIEGAGVHYMSSPIGHKWDEGRTL